MVKTFDQPKREAIIICPQHGRLETRPEPGYVKDKAGNSHFFHLAYCSQCGTFYTTYRTLTDIWAEPKQNGVPIRTVDPVSPHEAKRLDDARKAAAAAARRKEDVRPAVGDEPAQPEAQEKTGIQKKLCRRSPVDLSRRHRVFPPSRVRLCMSALSACRSACLTV